MGMGTVAAQDVHSSAHFASNGLNRLGFLTTIAWFIKNQVFREECLIYMVLEYGDIDLARLLQNHEEARRRQLAHGSASGSSSNGSGACAHSVAGGSGEIDENFIRLYWQQMLQGRGAGRRVRQGFEVWDQSGNCVALLRFLPTPPLPVRL
eukprot:1156499-Pelagomonas_calceolata.AAC.7